MATSDNCYHPTSSPRGASIPLSARVPPEYAQAISIILASGTTPWKTTSEFVRAAIHELILECQSKTDDETLPPVIALLRRWSRQATRSNVHAMLMEAVADISTALREYEGADGRLLSELDELCQDLMNLKDPYWKKKCLNALFSIEGIAEVAEKEEASAVITTAFRAWAGF